MPKNDSETEKTAPRRLPPLPLLESGAVDWDHVRPTTAQKFLDVLRNDPKVREEYNEMNGLGEDEIDPFGGISQENIRTAIDGIAKANAAIFQFIAAKWIKHPLGLQDSNGRPLTLVIDHASLAKMQFTPEQHAEMDPRGVKIAQKYAGKMPEWLKKHFDLYMLAAMFLSYSAENAKSVIGSQIQKDFLRYQQAVETVKQMNRRGPQADSDVPKRPTNGVDTNPPVEFSQPDGEEPEAPVV